MPLYQFQNPKTNEVIEVVQKMKDEHVYFDDDGLEWNRVWTNPQMRVGSFTDPYCFKSFDIATEGKNYTLGDMWDRCEEESKKRADKEGGQDPIKKKAMEKYSKKRKGMKYTKDGSGFTGGSDTPNVQISE